MNNREKIINTALHLFTTKGYDSTSVNQIIDEVGIAKGTFYHYFNSKDEVMNEVINLVIDEDVAIINEIINDDSLSGFEKFKKVILEAGLREQTRKADVVNQLHTLNDPYFHQKGLNEAILKIAPAIAFTIEQGNREGSFNCLYPLETTEFLLGASNTILDEGNFTWTKEEFAKKTIAYVEMCEKVLGCTKGSLDFLIKQ